MSEKIFINGVFIREKQFDNGGKIITIDIPDIEQFYGQMRKLAEPSGKIRFDLKERLNKSDNGLTHYMQLNTFKPKPQQEQSYSNNNFDDDVPF